MSVAAGMTAPISIGLQMISIETDFQAVRQSLGGLARQADFAMSRTLNDLAVGVRDAISAEARRVLDRPREFSIGRGAMVIEPARKDRLQSGVFFKPIQAEYMRLAIDGGTRTPGGEGLRLPGRIPLDAGGNIPRGVIGRLKSIARVQGGIARRKSKRLGVSRGSEIFFGDPKDYGGRDRPWGLYRIIRRNGDDDLMIALAQFPRTPAHYERRLDIHAAALGYIEQNTSRIFDERLTQALASALAAG